MTKDLAIEKQNRLEGLMPNFNEKQQAFLIARTQASNDADACAEADISVSSPPRWKHDGKFNEGYELAISIFEEAREVFIPEADVEKMSEGQLAAFEDILPQVFQEHIRLALYAESESVRMRAIQDIYDRLGIGEQTNRGDFEGKNVFVQMIQMLQPQIEASEDRDERFLEGAFREIAGQGE